MFVQWCNFYPDKYEEVFRLIYGPVLGDHFISKFNGLCERHEVKTAWLDLYLEMTDHNREKWLSWMRENF